MSDSRLSRLFISCLVAFIVVGTLLMFVYFERPSESEVGQQLRAENAELQSENQALKEEIGRLDDILDRYEAIMDEYDAAIDETASALEDLALPETTDGTEEARTYQNYKDRYGEEVLTVEMMEEFTTADGQPIMLHGNPAKYTLADYSSHHIGVGNPRPTRGPAIIESVPVERPEEAPPEIRICGLAQIGDQKIFILLANDEQCQYAIISDGAGDSEVP